MARVLVFMPAAGEVYDHDCVRAYNYKDVRRNLDRYYNMGDLFVYDSSLKLIKYDYMETLKLKNISDYDIDRYNSEFDYCFLRGSNYIHPRINWNGADLALKKIKIPVIPFGIGAQAPVAGELNLSQETIRVLRIMSDSCAAVGVRGAYTAEILSGLGIKNVEIIGCPTLYRNNNPDLSIRLEPLSKVEAVGFTLRREVSKSYSSAIERYLRDQKKLIFDLNDRFSLTVMSQGETEEKKFFYKDERSDIESASRSLISKGWFESNEDVMREIYINQIFYSDSVSGYESLVRKLDLVLGYRLHGNLIALANGTPSIYFSYDSRTREFAETYKIPCYDVDSSDKFSLEDYYSQNLFNKFNKRYKHYYKVMSKFLTENGISHKMKKN